MMVEQFGITMTDSAFNGQECVDQIKTKAKVECTCKHRGYKLIFMDINMPIMDGFTATQNIQ